jgi:UTP-glucose-1-phosphate uridylyltransferase
MKEAEKYLGQPIVIVNKPGAGGEIQITDALAELAKEEGMYAYEFDGVLHDTGDKLEYLRPTCIMQ